MKKDEIVSGILKNSKEESILFLIDRNTFCVNFYTSNIYQLKGNNEPIELCPKNNFLYGKTHDNHNIAIYYSHKLLSLITNADVITSSYIISSSNIEPEDLDGFDAVCFKGGILNELFKINQLNIEYEKDKIILNKKDDSKKFSIKTSQEDFEIVIQSCSHGKQGLKGIKIENNDVELILKFKEHQDISKLYYHYHKIKEVLCFMVYRDNVVFDEIYLMNSSTILDDLYRIADVYIKEEKEKFTKNYFQNINFDDIQSIMPKMMETIYSQSDNKYSYDFGFLPKNDTDANWMTNSKIRNITSALECELEFFEFEKVKNEALNELIDRVKKEIKAFKSTDSKLEEKTYQMIFSTISTWKFSLAEKICYLYHQFEQEMEILNQLNIILTEDDIHEFVKYRNSITHGRYRVNNIKISYTAHILSGLVYCAFLERMGMDRDSIQNLCRYKLLT